MFCLNPPPLCPQAEWGFLLSLTPTPLRWRGEKCALKMNPEIANHAYEQIDNQILRLLLYFGGAVILTLSASLAYLWHAWRSDQRERINIDVVSANAMNSVANELENLRDQIAELRQTVAAKMTHHER